MRTRTALGRLALGLGLACGNGGGGRSSAEDERALIDACEGLATEVCCGASCPVG